MKKPFRISLLIFILLIATSGIVFAIPQTTKTAKAENYTFNEAFGCNQRVGLGSSRAEFFATINNYSKIDNWVYYANSDPYISIQKTGDLAWNIMYSELYGTITVSTKNYSISYFVNLTNSGKLRYSIDTEQNFPSKNWSAWNGVFIFELPSTTSVQDVVITSDFFGPFSKHVIKTVSLKYCVDNTPPTLSFEKVISNYSNQLFTVNTSDANPHILNYQTPGNAVWKEFSNPTFTLPEGSTNGIYNFKAIDKAGNTSATYSVTYDNTPPTLSSSIPNGGYTNKSFTINGADNIGFSKIQMQVPNSSSWTAVNAASYNLTAGSAVNGTYKFQGIDEAGNTGAIYSIIYDNTLPTLTSSITSGGYTNKSFTINGADNIGFSKIQMQVPNSSSWTDVNAASHTLPSSSVNGTYKFRAIDKAGNTGATYNIIYDNTLPTLSSSITNGGFTNNAFSINGADNIGFSKIQMQVPNSSNWTDINATNYTLPAGSANGTYKFQGVDNAGNTSAIYSVTYDNTPPTLISGITNGGYTNKSFTINGADNIGFSKIQMQVPNNSSWADINAASYSLPAGSTNGTYNFRAIDKAGSTGAIYSITYDTISPILSIKTEITKYEVMDEQRTNSNVYFSVTGEQYGHSYKIYILENGVFKLLTKWLNYKESQFFYSSDEGMYSTNLYQTKQQTVDYIIIREQKKIKNITYQTINSEKVVLEDKRLAVAGCAAFEYDNKIFIQKTTLDSYIKNKANNIATSAPYQIFNEIDINEEATFKIEVTDVSGNITSKTITIDKIPPTIILTGVTNGGITKNDVNVKWLTENYSEIFLDGIRPQNITSINGYSQFTISALNNSTYFYKIKITDTAGNSSEVSFTIDTVAPIGVLSGVTNNGYTNGNVSFSWSEANCIATLNGATYPKGTLITTVGYHTLVLSDSAMNSTSYSFTIDKTAPTLTSSIANGGFTNNAFSINGADNIVFSKIQMQAPNSSIWADINAASYTLPAGSDNGIYKFKGIDKAGNTSAIYSVTYDNTPPTLASSIANGGFTKNVFTINGADNIGFSKIQMQVPNNSSWADINAASYTLSAGSVNGTYKFQGVDNAGNISNEYHIIYDTIAPALTSSIADGGFTNGNVILSWTEEYLILKINGSIVDAAVQKYTILPEANTSNAYTAVLTDRAGNSCSISFTCDTIKPMLTSNIANGGYTNKSFTINGADNIGFSKIQMQVPNSSSWTAVNAASYNLTAGSAVNGTYKFQGIDEAGNASAVYSIIYDTIAPAGTLSGVTNNGYTNGNVSFSWSEVSCIATLNGASYPKGTLVTTVGYHTLVLSDSAMNSTSYTFTIDRTVPTGTLSGVANGGYTTGNVSFSWNKDNCTAKLDEKTDGSFIPYTKNSLITTEGFHSITVVDRSGNSSEKYTFTIDKTAPVGILTGVSNGGFTNQNVSFDWNDTVCTATLNGAPYVKGTLITSVENYILVLTDLAFNSTTYTFTIDRTPPTGTLSGVVNGGITKSNVTFSWSESNCTAFLKKLPGQSETEYASGNTISLENSYMITLIDAAGNSSIYTFEICKTSPTIIFSKNATNILGNVHYYNENFYIDWVSPEKNNYTALLNNVAYSKKTTISFENTYSFSLTDSAGNVTSKTIVLNKTPYTQNLNEFKKQLKYHLNHWFETYEYAFQNNSYIKKTNWAFSTSDYAKAYAKQREEKIIETHSAYTGGAIVCDWAKRTVDNFDVDSTAQMLGNSFFVYYDIHDQNKLTAYFHYDNLIAALEKYASASISEKYIPNSPVSPYPGDIGIPEQLLYLNILYYKGESLSFSKAPTDVKLYVNNVAVTYSFILKPGINNVREVDLCGNITEYTIVLDTTPPKVNVFDYSNNRITEYEQQFNNQQTIYTSKQFRLSITDDYDINALFSVSYEGVKTTILNGFYDFSQSGEYTLKTMDLAGNSQSFTILVSLIPPTITITEQYDKRNVLLGFDLKINKGIPQNTIMAIIVLKFNSLTSTYDVVLNDDSNTPQSISKSILNYYFATSGEYRIEVLDNYGRTTSVDYSFVKAAPLGKLFTASGVQLENGGATQQNVQFTWTDDTCFATLNDLEYKANAWIMTEGKYTIKLNNLNGDVTTYTFTIDRTAPKVIIVGLPTSGTNTNQNVIVSWDKILEAKTVGYIKINNETTYFPYENGSTISTSGKYSIKIIDAAGNISLYSFEIRKSMASISIKTASGKVLFDPNISEKPSSQFITNETTFFEWIESGVVAKLNGTIYRSKTNIDNSGLYTFSAEDIFGNLASFTLVINKTAPVGTLIGVNPDSATKDDVYFTWDDEKLSATHNGKNYIKDSVINTAEKHTIILKNELGTTTTYTFTIDRTAPTGTLSGVTNNGYTNGSISFSWSEENCYAILKKGIIGESNVGESYLKKTTIAEEGTYQLQLYDAVGNCSIYSFTILKTKPIGEFSAAGNEIDKILYFNKDISFSWNEANCTATLNGKLYIKNSLIVEESNFTIVLQDIASNATTYTFVIDKTKPNFTFSPAYNKLADIYYFKNAFSLTWNDSKITAFLNEQLYVKNTSIKIEGRMEFTLFDAALNKIDIQAILDTTSPIGYFSDEKPPIDDIYYFNQNVSFAWDEANCTATLNLAPYEKNTVFNDDMTYSIKLSDLSGNITSYTAVIKKTKPTGSFTTAYNIYSTIINEQEVDQFCFKGATSFTWKEANTTATLNGEPYGKGTFINTENEYILILYDIFGNSSYYYFDLDFKKIIPSFSAQGNASYNAIYYKQDVRITWEYNDIIIASLNGEPYVKDSLIVDEKTYIFVLTDKNLNSTTQTFIIDKTAPSGTLSGVASGGITADNITFSWREENCKATLNGETYSKGVLISNEKEYSIILTDLALNESKYTFTINKNRPTGTLSGVINDGKTKGNVYFSWNEAGFSATLNGLNLINNSTISSEGFYTIILTGINSISTTYTFEIDRTPPIGTLSGVINGGITANSVTFSWSESGCKAYLNDVLYNKGAEISSEGTHILVLVDVAGNTSSYFFEISKNSPTGTLIGVVNGGSTKENVYFSWNEAGFSATLNGLNLINNSTISSEGFYTIILTGINSISTTYTFEIDRTPPIGTLSGVVNGGITANSVTFSWSETGCKAYLNEVLYNKGAIIATEGTHTIILVDVAGNSCSYTFEISKTLPVGTLVGVSNNGRTKNNVMLTWLNSKNYEATLNNLSYENGAVITNEGFYTLVLTGPNLLKSTYTFTIDRTAPTGTLSGVTNGGISNKPVSFTWNNTKYRATLNGEPYVKGTAIIADGKYNILLVDDIENEKVYSFEIFSKKPFGNLTGVVDGGYTYTDVSFAWDDESIISVYLNGERYSNGDIITAEGFYSLVLMNIVNIETIYTFTIDRTAPTGVLVGVSNEGRTNQPVYLTWDDNTLEVLLNNIKYIKNTPITADGYYIFTVIDAAMNSTTYTFTIDSTKKMFYISENPSNIIGDKFYYKDKVTLFWNTPNCQFYINKNLVSAENSYVLDKEGVQLLKLIDDIGNEFSQTIILDFSVPAAIIKTLNNNNISNKNIIITWENDTHIGILDGKPYVQGTVISLENSYNFSLVALNGNTTNYTFSIDKTAPNCTLVGVVNNGRTNAAYVSAYWSESYFVEYYYINNLGEKFTDPLDFVSVDETSSKYIFSKEGFYSISFEDNANNISIYTFTIYRTLPSGVLTKISDNSKIENEEHINEDAAFDWENPTFTAKLNGKNYIKKTPIKLDGYYELLLSDEIGNIKVYSFTIDTEKANGTLVGVENKGYTNQSVHFTWAEENCKAYLNDVLYKKGAIIDIEGSYAINLVDIAGNISSYTFTIDRTAPVGEFSEKGRIIDGVLYFSKFIFFTWDDTNCTASIDKMSYKNGNLITYEKAIVKLVLKDIAQNFTVYNIFIDTTPPVYDLIMESGEISKLKDGKTYTFASEITFSSTETLTLFINDEEVTTTKNLAPGTYNLKVVGISGNTSEIIIIINTPLEKSKDVNVANIVLIILIIILSLIIITFLLKTFLKRKIATKRRN